MVRFVLSENGAVESIEASDAGKVLILGDPRVTPYWMSVEKGGVIREGAFVWVRARRYTWKEGVQRGGPPNLGRFLEIRATIFLNEEAWTEVWRGLATGQVTHTEYRESARLVANNLVLADYEEGIFESWTPVSFVEPGEVPRASGVLHANLPQFLANSFLRDPEERVVAVLRVARESGVRARGLFWLYTRCVDAGVPPRGELSTIFGRLREFEEIRAHVADVPYARLFGEEQVANRRGWGETPQVRATGARPEVRAPPPPASPPPTPPVPIAAVMQGGPRPNNKQARSGCVYCNEESHIKRDCPHLTEALRLGVVKLNENKWVVWGDGGEAVSFYPSMKVNVDKRITLQEASLGKKLKIGGTSNSSHVQMTESPGGVSIREPQVSSIKFVETRPEEDGSCLRVRTQAGAETSKSQENVSENGGGRSGDDDQQMADAKVAEEKKEEPTSPKSPRKRAAEKFEMKCTLDEIDTVAPLKRTLMQPMQCTLLEYLAASKSAREELLSITKKVRVPLARGPTVPGEGPAKEEVQSSRITMEELSANFFSGEDAKKFYVLGSGQLHAVVSGKKMRALVDNGSESTVCRDSIAQ
ncbi:hypothetical protein CBR_g25907 [Chara braunii]|uniref:CCHC-type domain-containing protein n=1 Tax=Chara braunii TaxID=69332 RepID=A0A388L6Q1_CHABU|nr:hypothetical protein CBR_g25907 [Chara braunii]|eukprot:GBG77976.1 hypothetical protein CBR_g25907 [Chara braunii]